MSFLRWMLFLPAGIAGGLALSIFVQFAGPSEFIEMIMGGAGATLGTVFAGLAVAPSKNRFAKWTLVGFCLIVGFIDTIHQWLPTSSEDDPLAFVRGLSMFIAAILCITVPANEILPPDDSVAKQSGLLSVKDAEDIVMDFANIMAKSPQMIWDAEVLPCSRDRLKEAFGIFLDWLYQWRKRDLTSFGSSGHHETLRHAEALLCHVDDFHDIDPRDKAAVAKLNSLGMDEDIDMELAKLMLKYPAGGAKRSV